MESLSVCIPTHFRANELVKCLNALTTQLQEQDQLIIGIDFIIGTDPQVL